MRFEQILVLDDELIIRKTLQEFLVRKRSRVRTASRLQEALELLEKEDHGFDLMFLDVNLPDGVGTDVLEVLREMENPPLAIMITGQGTIESAVRCMKLGAFDYLLKPFSNDEIDIILEKAAKYQKLVRVNQGLTTATTETGTRTMIGNSPPMEKLQELIRNVSQTDATVLVSGETGTGKELIAHAIHTASQRRNKPFIKVNCAAVSETLIESEFFGHEKGAFTGAVQNRIGRFELAEGGTLLLDEVSEISLALQAKLLRVLQEREFERGGGTKTIKVNARIVATTNRDLHQSVQDGEFREDLYYRLNVFPLDSPSLRDRREDIPCIAASFLREYARKHGRKATSFSSDAMRALMLYDWAGNVRELQNAVERAVILNAQGAAIELSALPLEVQKVLESTEGSSDAEALPTVPFPVSESMLEVAPVVEAPVVEAVVVEAVEASDAGGDAAVAELLAASEDLSLAAVERQLILNCLRKCAGNRTHAAKLMQVSIRTLRNKLNQYKEEGRSEFEAY